MRGENDETRRVDEGVFKAHLDEISSDGATYAPVVHEDYFLLVVLDEKLVVDARLPNLVLYHKDPLSPVIVQNVVHQRRLAAPLRPKSTKKAKRMGGASGGKDLL